MDHHFISCMWWTALKRWRKHISDVACDLVAHQYSSRPATRVSACFHIDVGIINHP
jgi:hypothetical protein